MLVVQQLMAEENDREVWPEATRSNCSVRSARQRLSPVDRQGGTRSTRTRPEHQHGRLSGRNRSVQNLARGSGHDPERSAARRRATVSECGSVLRAGPPTGSAVRACGAPARRSRRRARRCRTTRGRRRRAGRSLPPAHWTLPRCPSPPIADRTAGGARYTECHRFAQCRFGVGRSHRQRPHLVRQCQRSLDRMEVGGVGDGCSRPSIDVPSGRTPIGASWRSGPA